MELAEVLLGIAISLVASAVAVIAGLSIRASRGYRRGRRAKKIHRDYGERIETERTRKWLLDYYRRRGASEDLYEVSSVPVDGPLPFFSKPAWRYPNRQVALSLETEAVLKQSAAVIRPGTLDILSEYIPLEDSDGSPWNEPILTLRCIDHASQIAVNWAEYFQYLSTCAALELETRRAILRGKPTPSRDAYASSLSQLARAELGAQAVGVCACVIIPDRHGEPQLLLQQRQQSLATYPGTYAVVPMFGCQPMISDPPTGASLTHDLLREFGEELFSIPELHGATSHVHHDWFYDLDPVRQLRDMTAVGELETIELGFGFDALNGELDIALLCWFSSAEFFERNRASMQANWEIRNIRKIGLFSEEMDQLLSNYSVHPGSAFAIDICRRFLRLEGDS